MGVRFGSGHLVVVMVLTAAACGSDEPAAPPGIFFPTVPIGDAYPAALMEGILEEQAGCLFVARSQIRETKRCKLGAWRTRDGSAFGTRETRPDQAREGEANVVTRSGSALTCGSRKIAGRRGLTGQYA